MSIFIIINVIFMNIVFGIVINTFAGKHAVFVWSKG